MDDLETINHPLQEERVYSQAEKKIRGKFVEEYRIDYDIEKAAIRTGYGASYAREMGNKFFNEPYVQRLIKQVEVAQEDVTGEDNKKRLLAALWKEANYRGAGSSHAARVAALAKLTSIAGLDAVNKNQMQMLGADGQPIDGVFVIPGTMTPEQWEAAAEAQQAALTAPETPKV